MINAPHIFISSDDALKIFGDKKNNERWRGRSFEEYAIIQYSREFYDLCGVNGLRFVYLGTHKGNLIR